MVGRTQEPLVSTIREKCRICYTCVRECPAKAIRMTGGQAEVLPERCIGCGNCVKVCTRGAKKVRSGVEPVLQLLSSGRRLAAIIAPSFPAEIPEMDPGLIPAALRASGFEVVTEVAFGADLVARRYKSLLIENPGKSYIAVNCPAVVSFVRKYHPDLVPFLAPIVSPMIAQARVVKLLYGPEFGVVFIGPCIAKKSEAEDGEVGGDVDAVLTFTEMADLFSRLGVHPDGLEPEEFNPPTPGLGALFPISRGMLQAADISEDLVSGEIVAAEGRMEFADALKEFESGDLESKLLEILVCNGCIMGPGMTTKAPIFSRRAMVSRYVRQRLEKINFNAWNVTTRRCSDLNLQRTFTTDDTRLTSPTEEQVTEILSRMGKREPDDELNCGACGYETCREHAIAIFKGMAESEMCLPYTIEELRTTVTSLAAVNAELAGAKEALLHAEKMASMGQLAAGIAHEVNNPLGVVLMYSHMLLEEHPCDEALSGDLRTIAEQASRCKSIVAGLLDFARQNKVALRDTDVESLVRRTSEALERPGGVDLKVECRMSDPVISIDEDQIAQVVTNLVSNAYAAMATGGTLTITLEDPGSNMVMRFADTGTGIAPENLGRIFEPFFTTKKVGSGTGLGLSVTYGIIKMHRGDITVDSRSDPALPPTGTTFTVKLPTGRSEKPLTAARQLSIGEEGI